MLTWANFVGGIAAASSLQLAMVVSPVFAAERPTSNLLVTKVAMSPVSIRFSWKLKGEYAPFYVALDKGYFKELGIEMSLGEALAAGNARLGAAEPGHGDLRAWYLRPASRFEGPVAQAGGALSPGDTDGYYLASKQSGSRAEGPLRVNPTGFPSAIRWVTSFRSFGKLNNIDCAKIKRVNLNLNALITELIAHHIDATSAYATNDLPILKAKGIDLVIMDLREHGLKGSGRQFDRQRQVDQRPSRSCTEHFGSHRERLCVFKT